MADPQILYDNFYTKIYNSGVEFCHKMQESKKIQQHILLGPQAWLYIKFIIRTLGFSPKFYP